MNYVVLLLSFFMLGTSAILSAYQEKSSFLSKQGIFMLSPSPENRNIVYEISVEYPEGSAEFFNKLLPEERIFLYYFWRACIPGNRITVDQHHYLGTTIIDLFEFVLANKKRMPDTLLSSVPAFMQDVEAFLTYLWTNHGQYFLRENGDEKRTPSTIGLSALTEDNLRKVIVALGYEQDVQTVDLLMAMIFDPSLDTRLTVPDAIEKSAVNIYAPNFTEKDYDAIPDNVRKKINAYFYLKQQEDQLVPASLVYSVDEKYAEELTVACSWLTKAYLHAKQYPQVFDESFVTSLAYLIKFFETGDEEWFKKHSIEWLKSNSRIDYNFGFIEVYHDPKGRRGFFQAEATVKTVDMKKLNALLPQLEKKMPIPLQWKRQTLGTMPNASMNHQLFGFGHLGPTVVTAAYCLPNYEEIRSEFGSKQIIYPAGKGLEMRLNPDLARYLFFPKNQAEWLINNDPEGLFSNDIWNVQCILHETLGHGSGRLGEHTFTDSENRVIGGVTYEIGQTIPVTNENVSEFLAGYESTIEELRAEINALYVSITYLDELVSCDLMKEWVDKFGQQTVIEWLILGMAGTGLRRIMQQSDNATEMSGDHARANSVIMNYLIDHGGMSIVEEPFTMNGDLYTVIGLTIDDLEQTKMLIEQLMIKVQAIKSTGDNTGAKDLVLTYGTKFKKPEYLSILKQNRRAIVGNVKAKALITPMFTLVHDEAGNPVDAAAYWPQDLAEQFAGYRELEFLTEE